MTPQHPSILFLDELTFASLMLQPTVYGLLQERRAGRHRLPDATFIVAAGTGVEDGAVAHDMSTALSDRLIHLQVRATATDWVDRFALPRALHRAVIAFIRTRPELLETTETALRRSETIACTPRSWARVARRRRQSLRWSPTTSRRRCRWPRCWRQARANTCRCTPPRCTG